MARTHLQTPLIGVSLALLFIAGCSDNKSTSGISLSKEATACYSEYVDLHGDIKNAYKAQMSTGIASQSEYGKAHYEGTGANEGRALPLGCKEHLQISTSCYASYVDQNDDLLSAFNVSRQQDKSAWGKWHYENRPAADTRALPSGCTYLAAPADPCKDKGIDDVTDAQWNYFIEQTPALSEYTPKSAKHWYCTDASGYGNASLTPPGQCPTGYTGTAPNCVEVVEEASSSSTVCGGALSGTTVNFGDSVQGSLAGRGVNTRQYAQIYTTSSAGRLKNFYFIVRTGFTPGTKMWLALYSDVGGSPSQLLDYTAEQTVTAAGTLQAASVNNYCLEASTKYWIAWHSDTTIPLYFEFIGGVLKASAVAYSSSPPGTFGNIFNGSTSRASVYLDYEKVD